MLNNYLDKLITFVQRRTKDYDVIINEIFLFNFDEYNTDYFVIENFISNINLAFPELKKTVVLLKDEIKREKKKNVLLFNDFIFDIIGDYVNVKKREKIKEKIKSILVSKREKHKIVCCNNIVNCSSCLFCGKIKNETKYFYNKKVNHKSKLELAVINYEKYLKRLFGFKKVNISSDILEDLNFTLWDSDYFSSDINNLSPNIISIYIKRRNKNKLRKKIKDYDIRTIKMYIAEKNGIEYDSSVPDDIIQKIKLFFINIHDEFRKITQRNNTPYNFITYKILQMYSNKIWKNKKSLLFYLNCIKLQNRSIIDKLEEDFEVLRKKLKLDKVDKINYNIDRDTEYIDKLLFNDMVNVHFEKIIGDEKIN